MSKAEHSGVLVFAERRGDGIQKIAYELLGMGRGIAFSLGEPLLALLAGSRVAPGEAESLIAAGADEVLLVDDPALAVYLTEPYAKVLTADCTALAVEEGTGNLLMTRPAFGGNLMATIVCPEHRPQMSTVRPGVMRRLEADPSRKGRVYRLAVDLADPDPEIEVLEAVVEKAERKNIEEASVLVSGGRGLGSAENFTRLEAVALELGGLVSASRAAVDSGWIGQDRQVGQTGKTVRPDLYLAMGISGMIQHIAGMEDSDFIVAVNKNPAAPIFEHADLGIVTDVNKLVPALVEELKVAKA